MKTEIVAFQVSDLNLGCFLILGIISFECSVYMCLSLLSPPTKCCGVMTINHFQIIEQKTSLEQTKNKLIKPDVFRMKVL